MKWMRHQPHAIVRKPAFVTINFYGDALFSVKTVRQIIKESKYVEIFFNREDSVLRHIGFRFFIQPTRLTNVLRFSNKKRNQAVLKMSRTISSEMGIRRHQAMRFPLEYDTESEIYYISVDKAELIDTSNYKH